MPRIQPGIHITSGSPARANTNALSPTGGHILRGGSSRDAADLMRTIIATLQTRTAHDIAADTEPDQLPDQVRSLCDRRTHAVHRRRAATKIGETLTQNYSPSGGAGSTRTLAAARSRALTMGSTPNPVWSG